MPLYRLYSNAVTNHFYTVSASEKDSAVNNSGYTFEGIAGYVYTDNSCGGIPFYRLYRAPSFDYVYTTSELQRDDAIQNHGFVLQGTAGYVVAA